MAMNGLPSLLGGHLSLWRPAEQIVDGGGKQAKIGMQSLWNYLRILPHMCFKIFGILKEKIRFAFSKCILRLEI